MEEERRLANDGSMYTHEEFLAFFGEEGQWWWTHAEGSEEVIIFIYKHITNVRLDS